MSKLLKKLKSRKGAIGMVALLLAMTAFAGTAAYTLGEFSEGHEETTVGVGVALNEIIPDPYVYVPVTHAAIPIIEAHNVTDTVILEGEDVNLSIYATIRDNGELSYRWMHKQEGALNYTVAGEGEEYAYSPLPGVYYVYGEAINTNTNVNGEQIASSKTPEAKIIVLAKAQQPSLSALPDFTTQFDNETKTYKINAMVTDEGTLTYKWFQTSNKAGSNPVLVNSTHTLSVNNPNENLYFYFAEITNTVNYEVFGRTHSTTVKTPVMTIEIVQHSIAPQISSLPNIVLKSEETSEFIMNATSLDGGTLSYKWYRNTTNSKTGATLIGSGLSNKVPVTFNTVLEGGLVKRFYYVDVVNELNYIDSKGATHTSQVTASSNIGRLEVYPKALTPSIQAISDQIIVIGSATANVVASVGDGGTLSYKWYKVPTKTNTGGTVVSTSSTLSLTGLVTGPTFYYVEITNSKPYIAENGTSYPNTATHKSNAFRIEKIEQAVMPTLSSLTNKVAVSGTTLNYSINATVTDNGYLSYKWFESTSNSYAGVLKSSSGSAFNYTPTIASGTSITYMYVEVTNLLDFVDSTGTVHRSTKTARSNIARLEIFTPAQIPTIGAMSDQNITGTTATITANATVTDGGALTYQWYKSSGSTNTAGTPLASPGNVANLTGIVIGPHYYYIDVVNSKPYTAVDGTVYPNTVSKKSPVVRIERIQLASVPSVGTLDNKVIQSGGSFTYAANASVTDGGVLSYTWLTSTNPAAVTEPIGTSSSMTVTPLVTNGTWSIRYYAVETKNTYTYTDATGYKHISTASKKSNIATVEIYPSANKPVIDPLEDSVVKSGTEVSFVPNITDINGTLTYEWYENSVNANGGTLKSTASTYSVTNTTATTITKYYSLKVTNKYDYTALNGTVYSTTSFTWSNVAKVEVYTSATAPVVGALGNSVVLSGTNVSFAPTVSGHNGVLTYKWYENTTNGTGGTQKSTSATYAVTHTTTSPLTRYYSLLVTNTITYMSESGTAYTHTTSTWSNVARVEVYPVVTAPVIGAIANQSHASNSVNISISATVTGHNGVLTYKWFQPASAINSGGVQVGTSATFTKSAVTPGIYFYYLEAVNTYTYTSASGTPYVQTASAKSNAVTIDVIKQAQAPAAFTLADKVHRSGQTTVYSTSASPDGGTLSYKWYENTANAFGGTQVATTSTYTVNRTIASGSMVRYYSVELINTISHTDSKGVIHTTTAVRNSNVARVETYAVAQAPVVGNIVSQTIPGATATITASATSPDGGTLSYAWYKVASAVVTGGTLQAGTGNSLNVSGLTVGVHYFYVSVTNSKPFTSLSGTVYPNDTVTTSNSVRIERYQSAVAPTVGTLSNQVLKSGVSATLSAGAASSDGGTLTYSWRESVTDDYSGAEVGTGSTYAVSKTTLSPITRFFYVEVTNRFNYTDAVGVVHTTTAMTRSNRARVEVYPVATSPSITALSNAIQRSGVGTAFAPTVTGQNGVLTYEWYENTANATGGTLKASTSSYTATVNTSSAVIRYYSLLVTNTYTYTAVGGTTHSDVSTKWSNVSRIEIYPVATIPTVGALSHRVVTSGTNVTYSASVTGHNGTLSYQWYENTANATGGTAKVTTASYTFNLTTTTNITRYYSVQVSNLYSYTALDGTVHTHSSTGWSNVARVEAYAVAGTPTVSAIANQSINTPGNTTIVASATSPDGGALTYKWFETTSATTSGGTQVGTSATITLSGLPVGRSYFYAEITNSKPFTSASGTVYANATIAKSNAVTIDVILQASNPTVGTLTHRVVISGTANAFSAGATSPDGGTLTYSWRESTTNAYAGTQVGTSSTYSVTHNITSAIRKFYYVETTNTVNYTDSDGIVHTSSKMVRSNIASVEVYPIADTPTVFLNEAYRDYYDGRFSGNAGGTVTNVTGTAEANPYGGTTYKLTKTGAANQWHGAQHAIGGLTLNAGDKLIVSGYYKTTSTLKAGFDSPGFYAAGWASHYGDRYNISSSNLDIVANNQWNFYEVTINITAQIPADSIFSMVNWGYSTGAGTLYIGNMSFAHVPAGTNNSAYAIPTATNHKLTAGVVKNDGGTLSYKWYENTSNAYGGTNVTTSSSLTINKSVASLTTAYYWVEITNTLSFTAASGTVYTNAKSGRSAIARVQFYPVATTPTLSSLAHQVVRTGVNASYSVSVSGHNGSLGYAWYENTGNGVGGAWLSSASSIARTHSTGSNLVRYISVYVLNTLSVTAYDGRVYTTTADRWSNVARLEVYPNATTPGASITGSQLVTIGTTATYYASVWGQNGSISYQWYENTGNGVGGTPTGTSSAQSINYGSRVTRYMSVLVTNTYYYTAVSGAVYSHSAQAWSNVSAYDTYSTANVPSISGVGNLTTYNGAFWSGASGSGNGSISYYWSTGSTASSISVGGLGLGNHGYSVQVTNTLNDKGVVTSQSATAYFTVTSNWLTTATDDGVSVTLRSGPSTGYSSLGSYAPGTRITEVYSTGSWYHVQLSNGAVGYIAQLTTIRGSYYMEEVTASSGVLYTTSGLNLRNAPVSGSVIASMPSGSRVYHLRITNSGWYRVLYISGSTWYVGWASGTYLRY